MRNSILLACGFLVASFSATTRLSAQLASGDLIDPGSGPDYSSDLVTPMHVSDGTVTRKIVDLKIGDSMNGVLTWARYADTHLRITQGEVFGNSGAWRHAWQYTLVEKPPSNGQGKRLDLVYPSGLRRDFTPTADGGWVAAPIYSEKITVGKHGLDLTTPSGAVLRFFARTIDGVMHYELQRVTDRFGGVAQLRYDSSGTLATITDSTGKNLRLKYRDIPVNAMAKTSLGMVDSAGGWQEIAVPADKQNQVFHSIRLNQYGASTADIGEIEVYAPGSTTPIAGKAVGSDKSSANITDGKTATSFTFTAAKGAVNWCGLDFFALGGSKVARVRVYFGPASPKKTTTLECSGFSIEPKNVRVLDRVDASTGDSVVYDYETVTKPTPKVNPGNLPGLSEASLIGAHYADGTTAHYGYKQVLRGARKTLVDADDPRYVGRAKHVTFDYHVADNLPAGMVHHAIDKGSGEILGQLDLDPSEPLKRTIHHVGGAVRTFTVTDTNEGRIASVSDAAGNTVAYDYDSTGRSKGWSIRDAHGHAANSPSAAASPVVFVKNASGRVESMKFPDGTQQTYEYDKLGRVVVLHDREGKVREYSYDGRGNAYEYVPPTPPISVVNP
jgi:YD repeat-containing protein